MDEVTTSLDSDLCDLRNDGVSQDSVSYNSSIIMNGDNIDMSEMSSIEKKYYRKLHKYSCSVIYFTSKKYLDTKYQLKSTQKILNSFISVVANRISKIVLI